MPGGAKGSALNAFYFRYGIPAWSLLAGYLLIGRGVRAHTGVATYSTSVYAVVCVVALAVAAAGRTLHVPSPRVTLLCLALAVVCTLGGHTVYNWALRHVRAATVSVAFLGEPPLTALLGAVILASADSPGGTNIWAGTKISFRPLAGS